MATQREILDAYNRLSARLVRGAGNRLASGFVSLGSWRDADYKNFLPFALGTIGGAKLQAARLQVAFYSQMAEIAGEKFSIPDIDPANFTTEALRNGATDTEVYRRPFVELYTALDKGKTVSDAIAAGANRISSIASTDVQLARRNAGFQTRSRNDRIVGYARTLTGAENCALCYVASTQRYTKGDLLPIHPGCDCGEMPIYGTQDPGQVIDELRLNATHDAVETRFGISDPGAREPDYRKIAIRDHGELGPTLTVADQDFTGPTKNIVTKTNGSTKRAAEEAIQTRAVPESTPPKIAPPTVSETQAREILAEQSPAEKLGLTTLNAERMTGQDKIKAAEIMFGKNSTQYKAAIERFGNQ